MRTRRYFQQLLLLAVGSISIVVTGESNAQQLFPDMVPWVREDAPYLVNWDISNGNLRMQTMFANIGDGLFQIRTDEAGTGGDTTNITQRVYTTLDNGPIYTDYFVESTLNFHHEHGHIHFDNFSEFQLLEAVVEPSGILTVGPLVANELKTSYRLHDTARIPDPQYNDRVSYPSSNTGLYQNVSAGFGDIYSHGTEGQSISLAGVPVGPLYWLRQIVDPNNVIREKDDGNNSALILIDLAKPGQAIRNLDGSFVQPGDMSPPIPGDLTGDRLIDIQDWVAFKAVADADLDGVDDGEAMLLGDLNLDRKHSISDVLLFRQYFESAQGAGSFARLAHVPEPATICACIMAALVLSLRRRGAWRKRVVHGIFVAVIISHLAAPRDVSARVTLMLEDFESLALGPNVDEALANPNAWTDTPPQGWSVDDSGIPFNGSSTHGVTEWKGWSFADKDWWVSAAGDQNRGMFSLGEGTVAVADPDEWDDLGAPINGSPFEGYYNALFSTSAISLANAAPESAELTFASSWRPECCDDGPNNSNDQTALIRVSYDGGANFSELLRWESEPASAFFKGDATNETVVLDLDNPADAENVIIEFGLMNAGNDWWWAVDNIEVFTPSVLEVNADTGEMSIIGAVEMTGYEITSAAGSLNGTAWKSGNLDAQNFDLLTPLGADFNGDNQVDAADYTVWRDSLGVDSDGDADGNGTTDVADFEIWKQQFGAIPAEGESWETLIANDHQLMEFYLLGSSTFESHAIGSGYDTATDARDLSFAYTASDGHEFSGVVRYVSANASSSLAIPEPATAMMLLAGAVTILPWYRGGDM